MDGISLYSSNVLGSISSCCILSASLVAYYKTHTWHDFYYVIASIVAETTDISLKQTINAAFFYFYFIILLLLLFITLCAVNICYTLTDNIVITISSAVCSFLFMIVFYLMTSEDLHIVPLLAKISSFFIAEMIIVAIIVLSQNI